MIQPDAKCVVNGAKVNEAIMALNPLLAMSVGYIGGGKPPQVTYSDGEVKILLPLADSVDGFSLEELDIVDTNNAASSRYFMTSTDSVSTYGTTTASTSGTPTGKQSTSQPTSKDRNSLGNTPSNNNRDQLSMNTSGALRDPSGGVAPTGNVTGGPKMSGFVAAGSQAARDNFDDTLGSKPKMSGFVAADSGQAAKDFDDTPKVGAPPRMGGFMVAADSGQAAKDFDDTPKVGGPPQISDTTPPPLPGAPPPNQPATSTQADAAPPSSAANTNITKMEDELRIAQEKLRSLKRTNNKELNPSTGYYDYSHVPAITSQQRLVDELKRQVAAARA